MSNILFNGPIRRQSTLRRVVTRLSDRSEINIVYKYMLFCPNFIFFILGIVLTAISIYILVLKEKRVTYFVEFLFDPTCLLCTAGSIMTVCAFFGCIGSLRENTAFLKTYNWLLILLFIFILLLIVFVFIFYFVEDVARKLKLYPEHFLQDAIVQYREDVDMRNFIDDLQQSLECCGVSNDNSGYLDWHNNPYFKCVLNPIAEQCSVPYSCCVMKEGENINYQCGYDALLHDNDISHQAAREGIHTRGCLLAVKGIIESNTWVIGGFLIGVLLPQAMFICMSRTLYEQVLVQRSKW